MGTKNGGLTALGSQFGAMKRAAGQIVAAGIVVSLASVVSASSAFVVEGSVDGGAFGISVAAVNSGFTTTETLVLGTHAITTASTQQASLTTTEAITVSQIFPEGSVPCRELQGRFAQRVGFSLGFDNGDASSTATVTRFPVLELPSGLGANAISGHIWSVSTPRTGWDNAPVRIHYGETPSERTPGDASVWVGSALEGPWYQVITIDDPAKGVASATISQDAGLVYLAVGWTDTPPAQALCETTTVLSCGETVSSMDLPVSSAILDSEVCAAQSEPTETRGLYFAIPPHSQAVISASAFHVGFALVQSCEITSAPFVAEFCPTGSAAPSLVVKNLADSTATQLLVVTSLVGAEAYSISMVCETFATCNQAVEVQCGDTIHSSELPLGMPGNGIGSCLNSAGNYQWLNVQVPPHSLMELRGYGQEGLELGTVDSCLASTSVLNSTCGTTSSLRVLTLSNTGATTSSRIVVISAPGPEEFAIEASCGLISGCYFAESIDCGLELEGNLMESALQTSGPLSDCKPEWNPNERWLTMEVTGTAVPITVTYEDRWHNAWSDSADDNGLGLGGSPTTQTLLVRHGQEPYDFDIFLSSLLPRGSHWQERRELYNSLTDSVHDIISSVDVDTSGTWIASWGRTRHLGGSSYDTDIALSKSVDGGQIWAGSVYPNGGINGRGDYEPQVAHVSGANWVVAYGSDVTTNTRIDVSISQDSGANWTSPTTLMQTTAPPSSLPTRGRVGVATDSDSRVMVVVDSTYNPWLNTSTTYSQVLYWLSEDSGQSWTTGGIVASQGPQGGLYPRVAHVNDRWIVTWTSGIYPNGSAGLPTSGSLVYASSSGNNGLTWTDPVCLTPSPYSNTKIEESSDIAADTSTGETIITWSSTRVVGGQWFTRNDRTVCVTRSLDGGLSWETATTVGSSSAVGAINGALRPRVVRGAGPEWIVVWPWSNAAGDVTGSDEDLVFVRGQGAATTGSLTWSSQRLVDDPGAYVSLFLSDAGCSDLSPLACTQSRNPDGSLQLVYYPEESHVGKTLYIRFGSLSNKPNQRLSISCFSKQ